MTRFTKVLLSAAAAALLLVAVPTRAQAQEFTILIYESEFDLAARIDPARSEAYWAKYNAFAGELAQAGVLRGGTALSESDALTVNAAGVRPIARSLRGTRTGGYFVIDVPTVEDAVAWARKAPLGRGGAAEVRAHRPNPTMSSPGTMAR